MYLGQSETAEGEFIDADSDLTGRWDGNERAEDALWACVGL